MSIFDILGPITVGPSSSHTAGAVRIGLLCRKILGENTKKARITFYGSFAETYRGHGTDKAVIGGLLGLDTDNEMIRESLRLAEFRGLSYTIKTADDPRQHPNTVKIDAAGETATASITGVSIGGGAIELRAINGFNVVAGCRLDTLAIFHKDHPGTLAGLSYQLSDSGYNISNLRLSRSKREGDVITVVETDSPVSDETLQLLRQVESVSSIIRIPKI